MSAESFWYLKQHVPAMANAGATSRGAALMNGRA